MNWDRVEGQWKQRRGKAVHHWGKLMNDELAATAGKHEQACGNAPREIRDCQRGSQATSHEFKKITEQLKKSNGKLMKFQKSPSKKVKLNREPVDAKRVSKKKTYSKKVSV